MIGLKYPFVNMSTVYNFDMICIVMLIFHGETSKR